MSAPIRFKLLFACCLCLCFGYCNAQTFFRFKDQAEKHKIPFDLYRNIIVMPLFINGQGPYNFIMDTGAGNCILTDPELVTKLSLQKGRNITINGGGTEQGVDAFLVHNITISNRDLASLPLTLAAFEKDPFYLSEYLGCTIHGILGYEFFNSFIVQINYQNHILTLYDPATFEIKNGYTGIPISIKNKRPFLEGYYSGGSDSLVPLKDILIDTGAGFPLSLETYSSDQISVPQKHREAELGVGLNGVLSGKIARAKHFGFSKYTFTDIVAAYPDYESTGVKQLNEMRNGSIGNFLLNRFTVIFDYANATLYVKPNAKLKEDFPYDRTGIEVIATGEDFVQFLVKTIKTGSPADEIGILPGDEIEEINFKKVTTYKLTEIDHIFSNPNSSAVTLRIKRGTEIYFMIVEMRDLI